MEKTHDEEMAIDLWELISALKKRALIILGERFKFCVNRKN